MRWVKLCVFILMRLWPFPSEGGQHIEIPKCALKHQPTLCCSNAGWSSSLHSLAILYLLTVLKILNSFWVIIIVIHYAFSFFVKDTTDRIKLECWIKKKENQPNKHLCYRAGEMDQWLKVLIVLPGALGHFPGLTQWCRTVCNSSSRESDAFSWPLQASVCMRCASIN